MSRIKELKNQPDNILNFVDLFSVFCPNKDKKSKYMEMILRLIKNSIKNRHTKGDLEKIIPYISKHYNISVKELEELPFLHLFTLYLIIENTDEKLVNLTHFVEYNENNLIEQNDLTKIKTIKQLNDLVSTAELKKLEKELEKQVKKIYENDEWLILRPLTHNSSKKYGSNTKWCTTNESKSYFLDYAAGILIYTINKKTGLKVAVSYRHDELSFWNQVDNRIDSLLSGLPSEIIGKIMDEIKHNNVGNLDLLDKKQQKEEKRDLLIKKISIEPIDDTVFETMLTEQNDELVREEYNFPDPEINNLGFENENPPQLVSVIWDEQPQLPETIDHQPSENITSVRVELPFMEKYSEPYDTMEDVCEAPDPDTDW